MTNMLKYYVYYNDRRYYQSKRRRKGKGSGLQITTKSMVTKMRIGSLIQHNSVHIPYCIHKIFQKEKKEKKPHRHRNAHKLLTILLQHQPILWLQHQMIIQLCHQLQHWQIKHQQLVAAAAAAQNNIGKGRVVSFFLVFILFFIYFCFAVFHLIRRHSIIYDDKIRKGNWKE